MRWSGMKTVAKRLSVKPDGSAEYFVDLRSDCQAGGVWVRCPNTLNARLAQLRSSFSPEAGVIKRDE